MAVTQSAIVKRLRVLETEVKSLKATIRRTPLPTWLEASMTEARVGKLSGPFRSIKDLALHLKGR